MSTTLDLIREAESLLSDCAEMTPEEVDARLSAWMSASTDKAAALQAVISRAESDAAYLAGEAKSLTTAAKRAESVADRCRAMLASLLVEREKLGESSTIRGPGWTVTLRRTVRVEVSNMSAIPQRFTRVKTVVEVDKAAIKQAIEAGEPVPGATLEEGASITIRK